ncbi:calcium:proton antiporter [Manganibacter manganicus]|uniref:Calcium:proton antiporter n=1 Tax=Manganibacter manganicus TaxID=1873176 RepID=A0A1V8RVQ4_9HYPH|nr:calcium:proton antiporter [Pseudaminobacter manganicus]OQM77235.1 calcium:proton antiporter [Pseudaminobacter manganicus]
MIFPDRDRTAGNARSSPAADPAQYSVKNEWFLAAALGTGLIFLGFHDHLFTRLNNPAWLAALLLWLFAIVLGSALNVVRHAEKIAERLGEPFGTLVLTLSITGIEVMSITAVMLHGEPNPTLVRDTLYSVVMIVLGGMVGLSLLLGALRHREQQYNLQGANAYFGVIVPLAVFSLVLPDFTVAANGPTLSGLQQIAVGLMAAGLYVAFLLLQMGRHRGYFALPEQSVEHARIAGQTTSVWPHVWLLLAYMVPIVFLVDQLARPIDYITETLGAPDAISGVIIAILVAAPEGIGAVQAARRNHLQRSVNIFLGSVLSTIGLTVPIMLTVAWITGHNLILGLEHVDLVLLVLTLAVSLITFGSGRTHVLQGLVHVLLFLSFLLFVFQD